MHKLSFADQQHVAGGDGTGEVVENLGEGLGHAIHGLTSDEAVIGAILSPLAGLVIGAIVHFENEH